MLSRSVIGDAHATFNHLVRSHSVKDRLIRTLGITSIVVVLVACGGDGRTLAPASPEQTESVAIAPAVDAIDDAESFDIRGTWTEGGDLDPRHTCLGDGTSPPFEIIAAPEQTVSIAVLLYAVDAPGDVLWAMANLAGNTVAVGEGATPPNVIVATNSDGALGYRAPCPSAGERRQYLLTVFALDGVVDSAAVTSADGVVDTEALLTAIEMQTFDLAESTFYAQGPQQ